jgi:predicted nuclease with TOPRIM domain
MANRALSVNSSDTEIAVLQVQVTNIETKINDLKADLKEVHDCLDKNAQETHRLIKELQESNSDSHKAISDKVSALEKWRWMMMGAGMVIGSFGFDTVAKLLK